MIEWCEDTNFAQRGDYGSISLNRELEAKMITGVINDESGIPLYSDSASNVTRWAQEYGIEYKKDIFKKDKDFSQFKKALLSWPIPFTNTYFFFPFDLIRGPILIKSPRFF